MFTQDAFTPVLSIEAAVAELKQDPWDTHIFIPMNLRDNPRAERELCKVLGFSDGELISAINRTGVGSVFGMLCPDPELRDIQLLVTRDPEREQPVFLICAALELPKLSHDEVNAA